LQATAVCRTAIKWLPSNGSCSCATGLSNNICLYVIAGFRREVDEFFALLGHYAASSGNYVPLLAA